MFGRDKNVLFSPCPDCGEDHDDSSFFFIGMPMGKGIKIFSILGEIPHYGQANFAALNELLWDLRSLDSEPGPVILEFNSPGGASGSVFTALNVLQTLHSPVYTVAHQADSAAGILVVVAGEPGHRYIYPDGRITLHNGKGGAENGRFQRYAARDINGRVIDYIDSRCDTNKILTDRKPGGWTATDDAQARKVALSELFDDDQYFNAQEALAYGLVDHIIDADIARELFSQPVKQKRAHSNS